MSKCWYKPRGDWFSFTKLRKLCVLCYCKQTSETSISKWHICDVLRHPPRKAYTYDSRRKWEKGVYNVLNMDIFLTKTHWFAQEAFIHPPEPSEALFNMDGCALFDVFWTVEQKHPQIAMKTLGKARIILYITLIGFVWKNKVIYT